MVLFGDKSDLENKIKEAYEILKVEENPSIKLILHNYIGNLYSALSVVSGKKMYPSKRYLFGNINNYRNFIQTTDFFTQSNLENFTFNKEFHQDYFNDVLLTSEILFISKIDENIASYSFESDELSKDDFFLILFDFCKSLGLEKYYEEVISKRRLYKMTKGDDCDNFLGLTTHNPLTGESNIFIDNFSYNFDSLFTFVHELGHCYDLSEFSSKDNIDKYIDYTFRSLYQEVMSRMFERLFLYYLIKNNILTSKAIDKLIDVELINHDYMFSAYAMSLLDDDILLSRRYMKLKRGEFYQMLTKYFECSKDTFCRMVGKPEEFMESVMYSYGDILSMFLQEAVLQEGFDSPLMKKFMNLRTSEFDVSFFEEENLDSSKYQNLFKKEIKLIKK